MKLMTKAIEKRFAAIGSQEGSKDPIVVAKYFYPAGSCTWFATEYLPEYRQFFGFVILFGDHNDEWGYFSLDQFEEFKGPIGLGIERDLYFREKRMSEACPKAIL
jgi:hypothetical protein